MAAVTVNAGSAAAAAAGSTAVAVEAALASLSHVVVGGKLAADPIAVAKDPSPIAVGKTQLIEDKKASSVDAKVILDATNDIAKKFADYKFGRDIPLPVCWASKATGEQILLAIGNEINSLAKLALSKDHGEKIYGQTYLDEIYSLVEMLQGRVEWLNSLGPQLQNLYNRIPKENDNEDGERCAFQVPSSLYHNPNMELRKVKLHLLIELLEIRDQNFLFMVTRPDVKRKDDNNPVVAMYRRMHDADYEYGSSYDEAFHKFRGKLMHALNHPEEDGDDNEISELREEYYCGLTIDVTNWHQQSLDKYESGNYAGAFNKLVQMHQYLVGHEQEETLAYFVTQAFGKAMKAQTDAVSKQQRERAIAASQRPPVARLPVVRLPARSH